MKNSNLIPAITFFLISWQILPSSEADLKKMHLRGQIKSITATEYSVDEKSGAALKDDPKRITTT